MNIAEAKVNVTSKIEVYKVKRRKLLPQNNDIDTFEWLIEKGELVDETKNMVLEAGINFFNNAFAGNEATVSNMYLDQNTNAPDRCADGALINYITPNAFGRTHSEWSTDPIEARYYGYFSFGGTKTEYNSVGLLDSSNNKLTRALFSSPVEKGQAFDVLVKYSLSLSSSDMTNYYMQRVVHALGDSSWIQYHCSLWCYDNNKPGWYSSSVSRWYNGDNCLRTENNEGLIMWWGSVNAQYTWHSITKVAFGQDTGNPDSESYYWMDSSVNWQANHKVFFLKIKINYS